MKLWLSWSYTNVLSHALTSSFKFDQERQNTISLYLFQGYSVCINSMVYVLVSLCTITFLVCLTVSSLPSGQSMSRSHLHHAEMQCPSAHEKCVCGWQVGAGQLTSSLLSPQSSSPSHTHRDWMHFPLPHVNSSERHVSSMQQKSH